MHQCDMQIWLRIVQRQRIIGFTQYQNSLVQICGDKQVLRCYEPLLHLGYIYIMAKSMS